MATTTNLSSLVINYLTQAQYDAAAAGGTLNENQLYLTPAETLAAVATSGSYNDLSNKPSIPSKTSDLTNDSNFVADASYVHADNNFTSALKTKLDGIQSLAQANVQSDWNQTISTADDYILNKPYNVSSFINDAEYLTLADLPTSTQLWYGTCTSTGSTGEVQCSGFVWGDTFISVHFVNRVEQLTGLTINGSETPIFIYDNDNNAFNPNVLYETCPAGSVITFRISKKINEAYYRGYIVARSNPRMITSSVSLPVANWSNNSQTVSVSSVKTSSIIFTSPAPASYDEYVINHVRCTGQGDGTLTFSCDFVPDAAITINVMIFS